MKNRLDWLLGTNRARRGAEPTLPDPTRPAPVRHDAYPAMFATDLETDRPVAIATRRPSELGDAIGWVRAQGAAVLVGEALRGVVRPRFGGRSPFSILIADIDTLGDLDDVVEELLSLRAEMPDLPVILVSAGFGADDFGSDRLPLCDASVRWPLDFARLELAITEAQINNDLWQARTAAPEAAAAVAIAV